MLKELAVITLVNAVAVDGDTIKTGGGSVVIRLADIDAPELKQVCGDGHPCGQEAKQALSSLLSQGVVTCESWSMDQYGRYLSTCWVGRVNVNAAMVNQGWAIPYTKAACTPKPEMAPRYVWDYLIAEGKGEGIHAHGGLQNPAEFRCQRKK